MDLPGLNRAPRPEAVAALLECCASTAWAEAMADRRPFRGVDELLTSAADEWWIRGEGDWLQAFGAHPRIGESRAGADRHSTWSRDEQSGMAEAAAEVAEAIAACNRDYAERFGFGFLIYAAGVEAAALLEACHRRLENDPDEEFLVAAAEQEKITELRLRKLLGID